MKAKIRNKYNASYTPKNCKTPKKNKIRTSDSPGDVIYPSLHLIGGVNAKVLANSPESHGETIRSSFLHFIIIDGIDIVRVVEKKLEFRFFVDLRGLVQEQSIVCHVGKMFLPNISDLEQNFSGDTAFKDWVLFRDETSDGDHETVPGSGNFLVDFIGDGSLDHVSHGKKKKKEGIPSRRQ